MPAWVKFLRERNRNWQFRFWQRSLSFIFPARVVWSSLVCNWDGRAKPYQSETPPPLPSPSFWSLLIPLVQIYFSPQPSAAVKIKDGSYNFYQDSVKHSPAKITLALQASLGHPGKFSQHGQLDLHSIFCLVTDRELMFDLLYLQREVLQLWQQ